MKTRLAPLIVCCLSISAAEGQDLPALDFRFQQALGLGREEGVVRRDPSDVIKAGGRYHVYYTKVVRGQVPAHSRHLGVSGYAGRIWHASSADGLKWQESGEVLSCGPQGAWDAFGVLTPGIIKHGGRYWLYYTGVKPTPGNPDGAFENNSTTDVTAIGVAVADAPEGPFRRHSDKPVLTISKEPDHFDSFRVDDACLLARDGRVWMYYKGRSLSKGKAGPRHTRMGVAVADHPAGPFRRLNEGKPVCDSGHEVQIFRHGAGVVSLVSNTGPNGRTLQYAADGLHFGVLQRDLKKMPAAPGLYRPELTDPDADAGLPRWGISMVYQDPHLLRFECDWGKERNGVGVVNPPDEAPAGS